MWGHGTTWSEFRQDAQGWDVYLDIAVVKEGYYAKHTRKRLGTIGGRHPYPPPNASLTIPMQPVAAAAPAHQQQQQQQQQTIVIPGGQTDQSKTEAVGRILLSADIPDAEVFVDGMFVGNAPASLKLKEGIHIIEVKKTGYQTYRREVRVLADSEVSLRATLKQ